VQEVDYPAVTLCNPRGHDTGEYVRAIFNNFVFLEKRKTKLSERWEECKAKGYISALPGLDI
jgi:hypothetical protein